MKYVLGWPKIYSLKKKNRCITKFFRISAGERRNFWKILKNGRVRSQIPVKMGTITIWTKFDVFFFGPVWWFFKTLQRIWVPCWNTKKMRYISVFLLEKITFFVILALFGSVTSLRTTMYVCLSVCLTVFTQKFLNFR